VDEFYAAVEKSLQHIESVSHSVIHQHCRLLLHTDKQLTSINTYGFEITKLGFPHVENSPEHTDKFSKYLDQKSMHEKVNTYC